VNILFVCNQGQNRSKTAAALFCGRFQTASAGLYSDPPVTKAQLAQADVIIAMEERHRQEIARRFPRVYLQKQILVLGIPDVYRNGQPELVKLLKERMHELLEDIERLVGKKKEEAARSRPQYTVSSSILPSSSFWPSRICSKLFCRQ
jgi:predicted protein tyrosine phosphatase